MPSPQALTERDGRRPARADRPGAREGLPLAVLLLAVVDVADVGRGDAAISRGRAHRRRRLRAAEHAADGDGAGFGSALTSGKALARGRCAGCFALEEGEEALCFQSIARQRRPSRRACGPGPRPICRCWPCRQGRPAPDAAPRAAQRFRQASRPVRSVDDDRVLGQAHVAVQRVVHLFLVWACRAARRGSVPGTSRPRAVQIDLLARALVHDLETVACQLGTRGEAAGASAWASSASGCMWTTTKDSES